MAERPLPAAINGTEQRLDALIARMDRLCDLLAPATAPEPPAGPVELREPKADLAPKRTAKATRR